MGKILIIDDDSDVRDFVKECLNQEYQTIEASSGEEALAALEAELPDLITLDLSLPDIEGLELCNQIKSQAQYSHIPIIVLSGRTSSGSHILAYKLGADIFVDKPFHHEEFKAIVDNRLKFKTLAKGMCGDLQVDLEGMNVSYNNKSLELTPKEFKIFQYLSQNKGQVISREQILERIWPGTAVSDRTIDGHVATLRKKIQGSKVKIESVYSMGYKLLV
jgi:two-component system alkaline phosphatase synthesis response regulator PhoP